MTTREFLRQSLTLDKQIRAKQTQLQRLKDMQYSIGGSLSPDKVQSTVNHDRMGDFTAAIIDLQDEYIKDITKLLGLRYEIKGIIEKVSDPMQRLILEERYVNLKRWEDIAADNNYSWNHVHRIHGKALKVIECYYISVV